MISLEDNVADHNGYHDDDDGDDDDDDDDDDDADPGLEVEALLTWQESIFPQ